MKNKKVLIGVIVAVVVVVIALVGGFIYNQQNKIKQENILNEEAEKLAKLDLTKDDIDMDIKTKRKYAIVEKTMKDYMKETQTVMTELIDLFNNSDLDKTLSSENLSKDAPEFVETKEKLASLKTKLNEYSEKCDQLLTTENIENAINDKGVNKYYKELYVNLMLDDETKESIEKDKTELKNSIEEVNKAIEGLEKIVNFLTENKDEWTVTDGRIQFKSITKYKEYYQIVNEL